MVIGYLDKNSYAIKRLIFEKESGSEYKELFFKTAGWFLRKVAGQLFPAYKMSNKYLREVFAYYRNYHLNEIDLVHTHNRKCFINKPWVVSVENTIPFKTKKKAEKDEFALECVKQILQENCIRILPYSKWAYENEKAFLLQYMDVQEREIIIRKMEVLYPPQDLLIKEKSLLKYNDLQGKEIKFIFIGREFWRKGGAIAVQGLKKVREYYPIKLVVVSNLNGNGFKKIKNNKKEWVDFLADNKEWIQWYKELPNGEVLKLLEKCHVGLLPTYGDTFGYSVLEMQAAGVPCITTNRMALGEINNNEVGWIIDTAKLDNEHGEFYGDYTETEIKDIGKFVEKELIDIVKRIVMGQEDIKEKAIKGLERIERVHSPIQYANRIKAIYEEALSYNRKCND